MNPNTIILAGLVTLAGAGVAWGAYALGKVALETVDKIKEENREYGRELAK